MPKGRRADTTNLSTGSYAFPVAYLSGYEVVAGQHISQSYVRILYKHFALSWSHTLYPKRGTVAEWDRLITRCQRRLIPALEGPAAALARTKKKHAKETKG